MSVESVIDPDDNICPMTGRLHRALLVMQQCLYGSAPIVKLHEAVLLVNEAYEEQRILYGDPTVRRPRGILGP
jgi:hypothetical protein